MARRLGADLFSESELEYRHVGNLLRVADFELLDRFGTRLARVREERLSWRRFFPVGALEPFVRRSLAFVDDHGRILMRCVRPPFFSRARLVLEGPWAEGGIELTEMHAIRSMAFAVTTPRDVQVGTIAATRLADRHFAVRDSNGNQVGEVWMTSIEPRSVLVYRLILSTEASRPLRVAAIGFIPGFHATRGGSLVPYRTWRGDQGGRPT